ncbi:hypothetical protein CDIK_0755 [Cucumispora dikerogammari]|nr:hypothetical protein CDIK_0755 [Cucumispora dikerogammari]
MFIRKILATQVFSEEEEYFDLKKIKYDMFMETNLYREMLGLRHLEQNESLTSAALQFTKKMVEKREFRENKSERLSLRDRNDVEIIIEKEHFSQSIHCISTLKGPLLGTYIIHSWQTCDLNNKSLIEPGFQNIGIAVEIGPSPLNIINGIIMPSGKYLYITQYFSTGDIRLEELPEIEITQYITDHLMRYKEYFCFYLNEFILGIRCFRKNVLENVIINNDRFDDIAQEQLLISIEHPDDDEKIKKKIITIVKRHNRNFSDVRVILLHFKRYIPPDRLIKKHNGIPEEIMHLIKTKKICISGMSVVLRKDKHFHICIIFVQHKKTFIEVVRSSVRSVFSLLTP